MANADVYGAPADDPDAQTELDCEIAPIMPGSDPAASRRRAEELDVPPTAASGCTASVVLRRVLLLMLAVGGFVAVFDVNFNVRFRWRSPSGAPSPSQTSTLAGLGGEGGGGGSQVAVAGAAGGARGAAPGPSGASPAQPNHPLEPPASQQAAPPQPPQQSPVLQQAQPPAPPPVGFFALGAAGSSSCPDGTWPLSEASACQKAVTFFGKSFAHFGKALRIGESTPEPMDPSGCVFREAEQDMYFNRHPGSSGRSGRRPVCGAMEAPKASFVMGEKGSPTCPEGTYALEDIRSCKSAGAFLLISYIAEEPKKVEGDPPGCVYHVRQEEAYFNTFEGGPGREDRQVICSSPVAPPVKPQPVALPSVVGAQHILVPAAGLSHGAGTFFFGEAGANSCPPGMFALLDADSCTAAVQALNLKSMRGFENEIAGDPKGCVYRAPDQDVYFNSHATGAGNQGRRPVCSKKAPPTPPPPIPEKEVDAEAAAVKIFCWAWTPLRPYDETLLPEVRIQYRKCDGHAFYTDKGTTSTMASDEDVFQVVVPEQSVPRTNKGWLYHRNMVGILPAWTHLLSSVDLKPYDWVVNTELDHFLSPARLRIAIVEYIRLLRTGSLSEKLSVDKAMLLMFGNAFLFNRKMVEEMRSQWEHLGKAADASSPANGCPAFMRGGIEWPLHCSQDIVYPTLVDIIRPRIASWGRSGCGQFDAKNGQGKPLPAGCWEMQRNPWGEGESGELDAIREFAKVQDMTRDEAREHYRGTSQANNWELWYWAKKVPIIHHVGHASVHKLARELLRP